MKDMELGLILLFIIAALVAVLFVSIIMDNPKPKRINVDGVNCVVFEKSISCDWLGLE